MNIAREVEEVRDMLTRALASSMMIATGGQYVSESAVAAANRKLNAVLLALRDAENLRGSLDALRAENHRLHDRLESLEDQHAEFWVRVPNAQFAALVQVARDAARLGCRCIANMCVICRAKALLSDLPEESAR